MVIMGALLCMLKKTGKGPRYMTASNSLATPPKKKLPLLLKIYAVALIALSVISIPIAAILGFYLPSLTSDAGTPIDTTTLVIAIVQIALTGVGAVMSIVLGVRMLRDRRRGARIAAEILVSRNQRRRYGVRGHAFGLAWPGPL